MQGGCNYSENLSWLFAINLYLCRRCRQTRQEHAKRRQSYQNSERMKTQRAALAVFYSRSRHFLSTQAHANR
jgi:hypothetical protein